MHICGTGAQSTQLTISTTVSSVAAMTTQIRYIKGVPSAESSRSVRGLGKSVSGKPYPRLYNARRPQLEPRTFRSHAIRLYRLHQSRPSRVYILYLKKTKTKEHLPVGWRTENERNASSLALPRWPLQNCCFPPGPRPMRPQSHGWEIQESRSCRGDTLASPDN